MGSGVEFLQEHLGRFSSFRGFSSTAKGSFYLLPSDEDLLLGTPAGQCHSAAALSLYTNWITALCGRDAPPWLGLGS